MIKITNRSFQYPFLIHANKVYLSAVQSLRSIMKIPVQLILIALLSQILVSCRQSAESFIETSSNSGTSENQESDLDTAVQEEIPVEDILIQEPEDYVNTDTLKRAQVLRATTYHEEELTKEELAGNWFGIYETNENYSLRQVQLSVSRAHDEIKGETGSTKTAWNVATADKSEPLYLLKGNEFENAEVPCAGIFNQSVFPGDTVQLNFLNQDYTLFATGSLITYDDGINLSRVENYKLFMETDFNAQKQVQLLVSFAYFDEAMVSILFAGDLNKDGYLDLILDNTDHYNVFNPTLYLSNGAEKKGTLEIAGWHLSVGC